MQPKLVENVNELKKRRNLSLFSADEEIAFQFWNACARERLFFIRDFYPPSLGQPKSGKYAGIARTPVLHFAAAYAGYIAEREKFLARRADFAGLLDAIVDANQKIVDQVDVLGSIANIGTAAGTLRQQGETIRKNFGQT